MFFIQRANGIAVHNAMNMYVQIRPMVWSKNKHTVMGKRRFTLIFYGFINQGLNNNYVDLTNYLK